MNLTPWWRKWLSSNPGIQTDRPLSSSNVPAVMIGVTAELNHRIGPIDRGDRYDTPLDEALRKHGYGETDGGGTMLSRDREIEYIDVEMYLHSLDNLSFVVETLEKQGAPKRSKLWFQKAGEKQEISFGVREGFAIYLDELNLSADVYGECDINVVVIELNRSLTGHGGIEGNWRGAAETALYIYGDSNALMRSLIDDFISSYPLCKRARVVDIAF